MILYRYEDRYYGFDTRIEERRFQVIKETPKGYWIIPDYYIIGYDSIEDYHGTKKWISKNALRRFAYPNKEDALVSFERRKNCQIQILESQLRQAKRAWAKAKDMIDEVNKVDDHFIIPKKRKRLSNLAREHDFFIKKSEMNI